MNNIKDLNEASQKVLMMMAQIDPIKDLSKASQKLMVIAQIDPLQMARIIGNIEQAKRDEDAITRLEERVKELEQKAG